MSTTQAQIIEELNKATLKFPQWPTDPLHALAILGEEFGELTKEVLQMTYEPHKTSVSKVRNEAIQTAAMAIRFLMSLDNYQFRESEQHTQKPDLTNIDLADQQFIGFATATYGHGGIIELVESMGLTENEWDALKSNNRLGLLSEDDIEDVDIFFQQHSFADAVKS